jgi:hypothetical protein
LFTVPFAAMEVDDHAGLREQVGRDVEEEAAGEPAGADIFVGGRHRCSFAAVRVTLSRVPGDWYTRFCGEGVIAISSPYPTTYQSWRTSSM